MKSAFSKFEDLKNFDKKWQPRKQSNKTTLVQGYSKTLAPMHDDEAALKYAKARAGDLKYDLPDEDKKTKGEQDGTSS